MQLQVQDCQCVSDHVYDRVWLDVTPSSNVVSKITCILTE